MNATIARFGYPATLLHEYRSWVVLLRPAQPTLGSLVLACKEDASSLGAVSAAAWSEVAAATADIERALHATFDPQKINYLALMMVDPHVHFHVIPRYSEPRRWNGVEFPDAGWPGQPDLASAVKLAGEQLAGLAQELESTFA